MTARSFIARLSAVCCIVAVCCLAQPAAGLCQDTARQTLSLAEVWKIALEQNKDVLCAREYKNKVQGMYVEARATALPHLTLKGSFYRGVDETEDILTSGFMPSLATASEGGLVMDQVIFTWGQVSAAIRGAKVGLLTAGDELRLYSQAALRDTAAGFYDVLLAKELLAISTGNLDSKKRHKDATDKRYKAGLATDYDVLAAQVGVENAKPDVITAENLVDTARDHLGFLLGMEGRAVDVAGSLARDLTSSTQTFEDAYAIALSNRPEVASVSHRTEMAKELATVYSSADKPRLDLHGEFGWKGLEASQIWAAGEESVVGVFFTFPFFDGYATRGKVAQAKSDEATLRIQSAKLKDAIGLDVSVAQRRVKETAQIVLSLSGTVSQAEKLLSMAEKGYEYGVKTRLDVEDAQLAVMQARGGLAKARRDYQVALINLKWTMGVLGE